MSGPRAGGLALVASNKRPERRSIVLSDLDYATPSERAKIFSEAGIAYEAGSLEAYLKAKCELGKSLASVYLCDEIVKALDAEDADDALRQIQDMVAKQNATITEAGSLLDKLRAALARAKTTEDRAFYRKQIAGVEQVLETVFADRVVEHGGRS